MKQVVPVALSQPALAALAGEDGAAAEGVPARLVAAIRLYLGDRDTGRPAWPFPDFLRGSETQVDAQLEIDIDDRLWDSFVAEAEQQDVSVQQLAEHAAFYFAAEIDAGRITQRIIDDLESGDTDG